MVEITIFDFAKISMAFKMVLYPPLDVIRLNMTSGTANEYFYLSLYSEKRLEVILEKLNVHF